MLAKIRDQHVIAQLSDVTDQLHIDRHLLHDLGGSRDSSTSRVGVFPFTARTDLCDARSYRPGLSLARAFEGARSIHEGFVNAARLLGANEWQITHTVVIPSTIAWVFASLSPAISFALIGVIVGDSSARGIGFLIIGSEARAEASGIMVAVIVLMLVGCAVGDDLALSATI